ncbi:MAG: DinB family protein [Pedobacter sp.]|nr:DinB family protein [Pedobacter sp.]
MDGIENAHRDFIHQLCQFSEQELNRVPNEGSWTAGQVTEHVIKSNEGILNKLLYGDVSQITRPYDVQVVLLKNIFRSEDKMKTASVLEPSQPPHELNDLLKSLRQQRDQQLEIINQKDLEELNIGLQFPPAPNGLTTYEWLIFMIEHTQRHCKQIESSYNEISLSKKFNL